MIGISFEEKYRLIFCILNISSANDWLTVPSCPYNIYISNICCDNQELKKTHKTCYWAAQGLNYNFNENLKKTCTDEHTWHKYNNMLTDCCSAIIKIQIIKNIDKIHLAIHISIQIQISRLKFAIHPFQSFIHQWKSII